MPITGSTVAWEELTLEKDIEGKIVKIDLLPVLVSVVINESIYKTLLGGTVSFRDTQNIFSSIPFVGNEKLTMKVKSTLNEESYEFEFNCIEPSPITKESNNEALIELTIIETGWEKFYLEYSTSFQSKRISEFIKEFSETTLGKKITELEATEDKFSFALPYMRFSNILKYLNQYAKSKKGYTGYLYYTNLKGEKNYQTFSGMLEKNPNMAMKEVRKQQLTENPNFFEVHTIDNNYNLINVLLDKGFGSTQIKFDTSTKSPIITKNKFENIIKQNKHTGKYSILNKLKDGEKAFHYRASTSNNKSNIGITLNERITGIAISVFATGILQRNVGTKASLTMIDSYDPRGANTVTSGDYIVDTIDHLFYPGQYSQVINFVSTSYYDKISINQVTL